MSADFPAAPPLVPGLAAEYVDGEDFYDDPDPQYGGIVTPVDPIDAAVGQIPHIVEHVVGECVRHHASGAFEDPEIFDRYYFPGGAEGSLAPVLIDILDGVTPAERQASAQDKHVDFKRQWCAARGLRYGVLTDEDQTLGTAQIRRKLVVPDAEVDERLAKEQAEREQAIEQARQEALAGVSAAAQDVTEAPAKGRVRRPRGEST
jgi:hypothetical protein